MAQEREELLKEKYRVKEEQDKVVKEKEVVAQKLVNEQMKIEEEKKKVKSEAEVIKDTIVKEA